MPLTQPVPRKRLHVRKAVYEGFARDDGLFDIEGRLTDVKEAGVFLPTSVDVAKTAVVVRPTTAESRFLTADTRAMVASITKASPATSITPSAAPK